MYIKGFVHDIYRGKKTMYAIEINGLSKQYKDVLAVDNLTLSINEGELFSLLGVNGAGKTTTIKILSCLTKASSGDAFLLGKSIKKDKENVKSIIAVSPQETAVAPALTVRENLELICGIYGYSRETEETVPVQEDPGSPSDQENIPFHR